MTTPKSRKRKTWRCFHCDEVFRSRKAAWAHFGPDQDCEKLPPACIDPLRADEKVRLTELREAQELAEFKSLTKCDSIHALRMTLDSAEGELITARTLIAAALERQRQSLDDRRSERKRPKCMPR